VCLRVCACVCVRVCEREKDNEKDRKRKRATGIHVVANSQINPISVCVYEMHTLSVSLFHTRTHTHTHTHILPQTCFTDCPRNIVYRLGLF